MNRNSSWEEGSACDARGTSAYQAALKEEEENNCEKLSGKKEQAKDETVRYGFSEHT